jgi:hypothetical protein
MSPQRPADLVPLADAARAVGRAQAPEYALLAEGLAAAAAHPALARLEPYPCALRGDLVAFIAALSEKDGARDAARGAVHSLGEAGEALRAALGRRFNRASIILVLRRHTRDTGARTRRDHRACIFIILADATVDHVEKTIRLMVAKATMKD